MHTADFMIQPRELIFHPMVPILAQGYAASALKYLKIKFELVPVRFCNFVDANLFRIPNRPLKHDVGMLISSFCLL